MTIQEWLDSPVYPDKPLLVRERLAELVYRNGFRLTVSGWGAMVMDGVYGWMGLEQEEALELIHLAGVIAGFKLAEGPGVEVVLTAAMKAEWALKGAV